MFSCLKRTFCCSPRKCRRENKIYVLKLRDKKFYVGESNNIERRIWVHQNENGSAWTRKYPVEEQIQPLTNLNNFDELAQTLELMRIHGIDNVRGSMFTKPFSLSSSEKIMAAQLYCELNNLCRKCGGNDHFIGQCKSERHEDWVENFGGRLSTEDTLVPESSRFCLECKKDITSLPKNYRYCRNCFYNKNKY